MQWGSAVAFEQRRICWHPSSSRLIYTLLFLLSVLFLQLVQLVMACPCCTKSRLEVSQDPGFAPQDVARSEQSQGA